MPEITSPNVSAIILAAGAASRMGSPKQLSRLGSKTLLEHTLASVHASSAAEIVLVLGSGAAAILPHIPPAGNLKVVINESFADGMGRSLQCGLAGLSPQSAATLVVLADQPLVKSSTLNLLIDEYRLHKPQILLPLYRGFRGNPVLIDRSVFPEIAALGGDTGCRAIFGDHLENIRQLNVDDAGILLDADRPADLVTLKQIYDAGAFTLPLFETVVTEPSRGPELVLVGREGVARSLAELTRLLGFRLTLVDPLLTFEEMPAATSILRVMDFSRLPASGSRFCVVASMGRFDEEALEQALAAAVPYIALVANKKRSQEVLHSLGFRGLSTAQLAQVRTKPGLSIGAQTPPEIALSIMAEIVGLKNAALENRER